MSILGPVFHQTFSKQVCSLIAEALERAVETATDHYEPERGSNGNTFGIDLYHAAVHELCEMAKRHPDIFRVSISKPYFRMWIGEYELCCHKIGRSESQDIKLSIPQSKTTARMMVQQELFHEDAYKPNLEMVRKLVIGYFANPIDGLRAVDLCVPAKLEGDLETLTAWVHTERVWQVEQLLVENVADAEKPPVEKVDDEITLRKRSSILETIENG